MLNDRLILRNGMVHMSRNWTNGNGCVMMKRWLNGILIEKLTENRNWHMVLLSRWRRSMTNSPLIVPSIKIRIMKIV